MEPVPLLDCAGRRRSPATLSSFHQGRTPRNKGRRYPPDPPSVEEIIAVMRACGSRPEGVRLRAVIVVLWRAGLRISEALALSESDLDPVAALCWSGTGKAASVARSGWTVGPGSSSTHGSSSVPGCQPAHCSVWSVARPAADPAGRLASEPSCTAPPRRPRSGDGSRRTSSDTRTRSRCPAKESRCWSSSASSGTPIWQ